MLGAAAAITALLSPAAAGAVSAETAIANLNAQRATNKIPAGIVVNPALSQGCAQHNSYMAQNSNLTHSEDPRLPGYTPEGAAAGNTSVLALGAPSWTTPETNPFETAPIHLAQLLDPSLLVSGFDESSRFTCAVTLAEPRRPEPPNPVLYTYPGPNTRIYAAEEAAERPFTPGDLLGLKQPQVTGPYIYIFADGVSPFASPKTRITSASLKRVGKKAKVKIKRIDSSHPELGPYIPPGGIVIPVKKLKKGKYQAKVTVAVAGRVLKKSWKFRAV